MPSHECTGFEKGSVFSQILISSWIYSNQAVLLAEASQPNQLSDNESE